MGVESEGMTIGYRQDADFREFVANAGGRLQRALVAGLGPDRGQDALSEALMHGWMNWSKIQAMANPVGYLYKVGFRWGVRTAKRERRGQLGFPTVVQSSVWVEPLLPAALESLSKRQRTVVVLIEGYEWSFGEVADLLGVSKGAVQSHHRRGLERLRRTLEVDNEV